jgi:hypothetical protein
MVCGEEPLYGVKEARTRSKCCRYLVARASVEVIDEYDQMAEPD